MSERHGRPVSSDGSVAASDRRSAQRYSTAGTPVLIGWREGDAQKTISGTLINISLGGCAAQVGSFPPAEGAIWLRLDGLPSSPWIQATVVETLRRWRLSGTRRIVRLRFAEPCPYDFFKGAIDGFTRELQLPDFEAEGYSVRDWR